MLKQRMSLCCAAVLVTKSSMCELLKSKLVINSRTRQCDSIVEWPPPLAPSLSFSLVPRPSSGVCDVFPVIKNKRQAGTNSEASLLGHDMPQSTRFGCGTQI